MENKAQATIAQLRKEGHTQIQIAEMTGVHQSTVSRIEKGITISGNAFDKVASFLVWRATSKNVETFQEQFDKEQDFINLLIMLSWIGVFVAFLVVIINSLLT
jgi:transcriptional regulator with XRE-family HTH domain